MHHIPTDQNKEISSVHILISILEPGLRPTGYQPRHMHLTTTLAATDWHAFPVCQALCDTVILFFLTHRDTSVYNVLVSFHKKYKFNGVMKDGNFFVHHLFCVIFSDSYIISVHMLC